MNGTAIRRWHMYIGLLTAPSLVFFCLTGAVQLFNLHEAHGKYRPFELVEKLSSVHKDQVLEPEHDDDHDHAHEHEESSAGAVALKVFFLLASLALSASAVLGVWIAVTQSRRKRLCWVLLSAGIVLPTILLALG